MAILNFQSIQKCTELIMNLQGRLLSSFLHDYSFFFEELQAFSKIDAGSKSPMEDSARMPFGSQSHNQPRTSHADSSHNDRAVESIKSPEISEDANSTIQESISSVEKDMTQAADTTHKVNLQSVRRNDSDMPDVSSPMQVSIEQQDRPQDSQVSLDSTNSADVQSSDCKSCSIILPETLQKDSDASKPKETVSEIEIKETEQSPADGVNMESLTAAFANTSLENSAVETAGLLKNDSPRSVSEPVQNLLKSENDNSQSSGEDETTGREDCDNEPQNLQLGSLGRSATEGCGELGNFKRKNDFDCSSELIRNSGLVGQTVRSLQEVSEPSFRLGAFDPFGYQGPMMSVYHSLPGVMRPRPSEVRTQLDIIDSLI